MNTESTTIELQTIENQQAMLKALEKTSGLIGLAAKIAGISRRSHYVWVDKYPDYKNAAEDILELQVDLVESKLLKNISNGDSQSIIFYLKTKGRNRGYSESVINKNLNLNVDASLTAEEAKKLLSEAEILYKIPKD